MSLRSNSFSVCSFPLFSLFIGTKRYSYDPHPIHLVWGYQCPHSSGAEITMRSLSTGQSFSQQSGHPSTVRLSSDVHHLPTNLSSWRRPHNRSLPWTGRSITSTTIQPIGCSQQTLSRVCPGQNDLSCLCRMSHATSSHDISRSL